MRKIRISVETLASVLEKYPSMKFELEKDDKSDLKKTQFESQPNCLALYQFFMVLGFAAKEFVYKF